jgi:hypothetical protein
VAEDQNTSPPAPAATPAQEREAERVSAADYKSNGKTLVRARKGYEVNPSDLKLPVITDAAPVNMSKEQADALMDEAGLYLVRTESKE